MAWLLAKSFYPAMLFSDDTGRIAQPLDQAKYLVQASRI
jgi:hypothetical protein